MFKYERIHSCYLFIIWQQITRLFMLFLSLQCVPGIFGTFAKVGVEQQKIAKEARENLKILEDELGKKHFFGDAKIGFMDVTSAWIICWAQIVEEVVDIRLIDAEEMPSLVSWFQNVLEAAPILDKKRVPDCQYATQNLSYFLRIRVPSTFCK